MRSIEHRFDRHSRRSEVPMATLLLFPGSAPAARRPVRVAPVVPLARPVMVPVARRAVVAARPPRVAPLRLTRRGRVLLRGLVALLVGAAVVVAVLLASRPAAAGMSARPVVARYHVVMPGETLWQIASAEVPGVDARDTAARIIELNQMQGSDLQAGQRLALPVAG
jgi:Tfp pilus assembly protein FimV